MLLLVLSSDITKTEVEEVYKVNSGIRIGLDLMWEVFFQPSSPETLEQTAGDLGETIRILKRSHL